MNEITSLTRRMSLFDFINRLVSLFSARGKVYVKGESSTGVNNATVAATGGSDLPQANEGVVTASLGGLSSSGSGSVAADVNKWYIAVDGSPTGAGTLADPWDIRQLYDKGTDHTVQPGDIVYVRGGTYTDPDGNATKIEGSAEKLCLIRNYPGETPHLTRGLAIYKPYVIVMGFEVYYPYTSRISEEGVSHPSDLFTPSGFNIAEPVHDIYIINNFIHDMGSGMTIGAGSENIYVYGNLVYNVGWEAPDRGHGHCCYAQNNSLDDTKPFILENNVLSNAFGNYGFHCYGESPQLRNTYIQKNFTFNCDDIVGGALPFDQFHILNNHHGGTGKFRSGYSNEYNETIEIKYNYYGKFTLMGWKDLTLTNNKYDELDFTPSPAETFRDISNNESMPTTTEIFWQRNKHEESYYVGIYNPTLQPYITLTDLPYEHYTIINCQNVSETQSDDPVLDMNAFTSVNPLGYSGGIYAKTNPAYLVIKVVKD